MGLWILEPKKRWDDHHVPGTAFMGAGGVADLTAVAGELDPNLKYDLTGNVPIVLIPQPSDDPNDPLNWPLWERDLITFILCLVSVMLIAHKPRPYPRPKHLLLLIVSSVWGGLASSYKSFLWARIIQGVAVCPFETLVNISVGEMYPVHKLGKRMALSNFSLFGGAFLTPVIVGKITGELGWQWSFYLISIFTGVLLPLVILWVPETSYNRSAHCNTTSSDQDNLVYPTVGQRHSFVKRMALFNGRKTSESPLKLFLRPIAVIFHPAVMWGMLTQGTMIGWTVMIGVVLAFVLTFPPLAFSEVETGYMYTGAFIGALVGLALTGPLADWSAKFLTKRNKGIYEPEFRLFLVIPQMLTGCLGLYMFGISTHNIPKYGWIWPDVFFMLEVMGMTMGAVTSALYLVDAYPDIAIESFTCLLLFKNFFSFALTWQAFNWVLTLGPRKLFIYVGSVQIAVCALTLPMYFFGKIIRDFMHRHDFLQMLGLGIEKPKRDARVGGQLGPAIELDETGSTNGKQGRSI
ncbi:MFS general substrate transporter [Choiromyces venosus 120613-1]|uniref:MFS general substrate transporter n=1 Tax=Choiromyces venosus 120613-1 TaxID=1336337 RepID=A0A3N4IY02_9PEZI|nr:MFS general substrate transporter [Choiromyces venosus 120613-1]